MANESFFVDDHVRLTMQDIDQQVRRYLTACEREKASYRLVEEAIATRLIPQVENLMSKDAMNGGIHPMKHHTYQGQPGLFCYNIFIVNYGFAKGHLYHELEKIGDVPFYDAGNMIDEGNRLLAMIEDLEQGMSCWDFPKKYFRIPKFKGTDGLLSGIERMIDDAIKSGFGWEKISDEMSYYNTTTEECGILLDVAPDKKLADYTLFSFLSNNRQPLGVGIPHMLSDGLYLNRKIKRYQLQLLFTLVDPLHNKDLFRLNRADFELVTKDIEAENIMDRGYFSTRVNINLFHENTQQFSSQLLKNKIFTQYHPKLGWMADSKLGMKSYASLGEEFYDQYEIGLKKLQAR